MKVAAVLTGLSKKPTPKTDDSPYVQFSITYKNVSKGKEYDRSRNTYWSLIASTTDINNPIQRAKLAALGTKYIESANALLKGNGYFSPAQYIRGINLLDSTGNLYTSHFAGKLIKETLDLLNTENTKRLKQRDKIINHLRETAENNAAGKSFLTTTKKPVSHDMLAPQKLKEAISKYQDGSVISLEALSNDARYTIRSLGIYLGGNTFREAHKKKMKEFGLVRTVKDGKTAFIVKKKKR
jgi:hypothetical protein